MKKKPFAMLAAFLLLAGCSSDKPAESTGNIAESSAPETTAETTAETTELTETTETTTTTTTEAGTTAETTQDTTGETTADTTAAPPSTTAPIMTNTFAQDDDTKLLWSERGLEIRAKDDEDGYGEELSAGSDYLEWTLKSFDGFTDDAGTVTELHADFARSSPLSTNGIMTVLPSTHPDYPNGLYLRVDNQADFPYFPADTRERGKFIIENAEEVYKWLKLDEPPVSTQYEVAVTVSVQTLHIHYTEGGYDTIRVTAASRR